MKKKAGKPSSTRIAYPADIVVWIEGIWQRILEKAFGVASLSERERVFYVVNEFINEVGNGGVEQYYFNSSGDHADEVVAALQAIGAASDAERVEACNRAFGQAVPRDREQRIEALGRAAERGGSAFAAVDDASGRATDLYHLLYCFYTTGTATSSEQLRISNPELFSDERFLEGVVARPVAEQFRFWLEALEKVTLSGPTATIENTGLGRFEVAEQLVRCEHFEIKPVLTLIDRYINAPQLNEKGSSQWKEHGAFSAESELVWAAFDLLKKRAEPESSLERKLLTWLVALYDDSVGKELIGLHLVETARVLHKLWPRKYPKPELGPDDNKLLNANAFLRRAN